MMLSLLKSAHYLSNPSPRHKSANTKQFIMDAVFLCRTQELVALSGAHTIGSKGFGSPVVFDNSYFKILLEKPWSDTGNQSHDKISILLMLFESIRPWLHEAMPQLML